MLRPPCRDGNAAARAARMAGSEEWTRWWVVIQAFRVETWYGMVGNVGWRAGMGVCVKGIGEQFWESKRDLRREG